MAGKVLSLSELKAKVAQSSKLADTVPDEEDLNVDRISTGVWKLDKACGGDFEHGFGIPKGRMIELFSPEGGGKTSMALSISHQIVKDGGVVVYIDMEQALDNHFIAQYGLEEGDNFSIYQPRSSEALLSLLEMIYESAGKIDLVVIDSTGACMSQAMSDKTEGSSSVMGGIAIATQDICYKHLKFKKKFNTTFVLISQLRADVNPDRFKKSEGTGAGQFNEGVTTTGGYAIRFFCSLRIKMEYGSGIAGYTLDPLSNEIIEQRTGTEIRVTTIKSRSGIQFGKSSFNMMYASNMIHRVISESLSQDKIIDVTKLPLNSNILADAMKNGKDLVGCGGYNNSLDMWNLAKEKGLINRGYRGSKGSPLVFSMPYNILEEEWNSWATGMEIENNIDNWFYWDEERKGLCITGAFDHLQTLLTYHPVFLKAMKRFLFSSLLNESNKQSDSNNTSDLEI